MNTKTILIIGIACAMSSCELYSKETDLVRLSDDYFEYSIGDKGTNALKCLNKDATLSDLYRFVNAECWNNHLRPKLSGRKLTREDADVLDFCMDVHLEMLDALGEVMLRDLLRATDFHLFVEIVQHEKQLNKVLSVSELERLRSKFIEGDEAVRKKIREWTDVYCSAPFEVATVLHSVFRASGDAGMGTVWLENGQFEGWRLSKNGALSIKLDQLIDKVYTKDRKTFENSVKQAISATGTQIGASWQSLHQQVQIYADEVRDICNSIDSLRKKWIADSPTKKILGDETSKWGARCEYATRKFDYLLYDLPCSMMSYRALGQLRDCKGFFSDNERKMKSAAADYTYALCGTELLKGIRTRYAASCYTDVIKFLKSELGWFTQTAFREFANETKLYNITLSTDENGKQDNILEKWETNGDQKTKGR